MQHNEESPVGASLRIPYSFVWVWEIFHGSGVFITGWLPAPWLWTAKSVCRWAFRLVVYYIDSMFRVEHWRVSLLLLFWMLYGLCISSMACWTLSGAWYIYNVIACDSCVCTCVSLLHVLLGFSVHLHNFGRLKNILNTHKFFENIIQRRQNGFRLPKNAIVY